MWVIPPEQNADFVYQMEQLLDVYKRPYDPAHPVVCLDESPKQLVSEVSKPIKMPDGSTRYDYEYERQGAAEVYMCFEPLAGSRSIKVVESHDRIQWATVVADIVENKYTDAQRITLVQDNLSAHKPSAMYELFEPQRAKAILDKIEFIFTPRHGSWLNMAEIELGILKRQGLSDRIASKVELERQVRNFENQRNNQSKKVKWQFSTEDARIKLRRLYPVIEYETSQKNLD
jgi:DDE superfamily endonuclease